jgi:hypothetical protein
VRKSFCSLMLGLIAFAGLADADIILDAPTVTAIGGGLYTWSYDIVLEPGEGLSSTSPAATGGDPSGDYFTIYDVAGFVGGVAVPSADWASSVQLTGVTPPGESVSDNASMENVTFFYIGSAEIIGSGQAIGSFGFDSTYSETTAGVFTAETLNTAVGGADPTQGSVVVPGAVPEPSSIGLLLTIVVLLGVLLVRRQRTAGC